MDEFALIEELFAPLARGAPGAFGLTDDAAVIGVQPGRELVVTKDMMVAGVHFLPDDPPELLGRKLLRINLSDLAAMGAEPRAYLLALAVPRGTGEDWLRSFAGGLAEDQAAFGLHLVGGDTVATDGPFAASITALGEVDAGCVLRRAGARPGDGIFVSGTLGDAALGLRALRGELPDVDASGRATLIGRYRLPQPRLALGHALRGAAHAAIDISDGPVADLDHICRCSGVGAEIDVARIPLSPAVKSALEADSGLLPLILGGGDDYELAFAASPEFAVSGLSRRLGLSLTAIGRVVAGSGVTVLDETGAPLALPLAGWRHF
ncbi:MAG: thiamine-phosphate kinase [Alphaproteobacteria bacterium]